MKQEQMRLMKAIYEAGFVIDELVLFLDTHPCDTDAIEHYKKYKKLYADLVRDYAHMFGPLYADQVSVENQWTWAKTPWPWEMEAC